MNRFIRVSGFFNIIFGAVFLIYWSLYGLFLPFKEYSTSIVPLVSDPDWVWINSLGAFAPMFGIVGVTGIFFIQKDKGNWGAITGFVLTVFGLTLASAQMFWETYIWKIISLSNPELLIYDGPLYNNAVLFGVMVTGAVIFSLGYFLLGIYSRNIDSLPSLGLQLLIIGAPLFGLATLFGPIQQIIRIIGIAGFSSGLIILGVRMQKIRDQDMQN
ncbi:MAG: hypothetical protein ISS19_03080 [Bacteroidales bacterium]|nr:hypothetical protein [Bacteroidales bacterium]